MEMEKVKNLSGIEIDFESAYYLMCPEIVMLIDQLGNIDSNNQEFFTRYEQAHKAIFGEEWELSKANPVW